jgi:hypothetical protein
MPPANRRLLPVAIAPRQGTLMRSPHSIAALENLGRARLSRSFFMRDFLYSEISNLYRVPNLPENPDHSPSRTASTCARSCWSRCKPPSDESPCAPRTVHRRSTPWGIKRAITADRISAISGDISGIIWMRRVTTSSDTHDVLRCDGPNSGEENPTTSKATGRGG